MNKVVARFADGRLVKGTTLNFPPSKRQFHITVATAPVDTQFPIDIEDLKALFYVKDFSGDPSHIDAWAPDTALPPGAHGSEPDSRMARCSKARRRPTILRLLGFFVEPANPRFEQQSLLRIRRSDHGGTPPLARAPTLIRTLGAMVERAG